MPLNIPYNNFIPLTTIYASQTNNNNGAIKTWADTHEVTTTGIHGVGAGNIVGTANANTFTNINLFNNAVRLRSPNYISNARFALSAGVLSLQNEDGTAPSASNPCYFRIPNNVGSAAGNYRTVTIDSQAYCLIQDSASADSYFYNGVNGTPWGTTTGVAWGNAMPLFVYLATETFGANPCLFLSRKPNLTILPAAAEIGYANNPPATPSENNVFAWTVNNVTASHAGQYCYLIGYVEVTKNTNDDFTFQTLVNQCANSYSFENRTYTMPDSQNNAASGSWFYVPAGTAPTYGSSSYTYSITRTGQVTVKFRFTNTIGNTPGAGGSSLYLSMPLIGSVFNNVICDIQNGANFASYCIRTTFPDAMTFIRVLTNVSVLGNDQNNASRHVYGDIIYKI